MAGSTALLPSVTRCSLEGSPAGRVDNGMMSPERIEGIAPQEVTALPEVPSYRELKMCTRLHKPVWAVSPLGNSGSSHRDTEVPRKETEACAAL